MNKDDQQVMADWQLKGFSKWRLPPYWIYFRRDFWHRRFWIVVHYVPVKFLKSTSTGGWVIKFCQKLKMTALSLNYYVAMLDHPVQLVIENLCSNFVSIEFVVSKISSIECF